jgi:hypothetical protein
MKTSVAAFVSLSLAACYGAAPPQPPRVPLPELADGAEIGVHSETKTEIEHVSRQATTCPAGVSEGNPACTVTRYTVAEPVTRTHTTASYGDQPISYAQFKVITDPHWNEKLAELDDLSHKCTRANVPRYVGMGLMLGGLITGAIVGGTAGQGILWGGLGGGAASYTLGYVAFGGRQCVEARDLYNEVNLSDAMSWNSVEGADYAVEMKTLAEQFNATHSRRTAHLDR